LCFWAFDKKLFQRISALFELSRASLNHLQSTAKCKETPEFSLEIIIPRNFLARQPRHCWTTFKNNNQNRFSYQKSMKSEEIQWKLSWKINSLRNSGNRRRKNKSIFFTTFLEIHWFMIFYFPALPSEPSTLSCQEKIYMESGCSIVERKCICEKRKLHICKDSPFRWDFKNSKVSFLLLAKNIRHQEILLPLSGMSTKPRKHSQKWSRFRRRLHTTAKEFW
jgi:hypothetical protein